jgi:hypothetical protein
VLLTQLPLVLAETAVLLAILATVTVYKDLHLLLALLILPAVDTAHGAKQVLTTAEAQEDLAAVLKTETGRLALLVVRVTKAVTHRLKALQPVVLLAKLVTLVVLEHPNHLLAKLVAMAQHHLSQVLL